MESCQFYQRRFLEESVKNSVHTRLNCVTPLKKCELLQRLALDSRGIGLQSIKARRVIGVGMKTVFLIMSILSVSLSAGAYDFRCAGTGRFSRIDSGLIALSSNSQDLLRTDTLKVSAHVDRSNYVGIDVVDLSAEPNSRFKSVRGSIRDTAMYSEGGSLETMSFIKCIPFATPTR